MRLSERTRLGLRALVRLAARDGSGSLSVAHIARAEGQSVQSIAQILNYLKRRGLVKSVRGPSGGYVLAKRPAEFSLAELFEKLDGKPAEWIQDVRPRPGEADEAQAAIVLFWARLAESIAQAHEGMTLKTLLDESRRAHSSKGKTPYTFTI